MELVCAAAIFHQPPQQRMVIRMKSNSYRLVRFHLLQRSQDQVINREQIALDGNSDEP